MHVNSFRLVVRHQKDFRLDIDATNFMELIRTTWPDSQQDPYGIDYKNLRLDSRELLKTLPHLDRGEAKAAEFPILNCSCGVPECSGVEPFKVRRTENVVHWHIPPVFRDLSPLTLAFDWAQYKREIEKLASAN